MKVILQQEAVFELPIDKQTAIPFQTFLNMVDVKKNDNEAEQTLPVVSLFKSIDAFRAEYEVNGAKYSDTDVYVMANGGICVFQRPFPANTESGPITADNTTETADGATSAEENQGE